MPFGRIAGTVLLLFAAFAASSAAYLALSAPALAHAQLRSAEPPAGTVLDGPPEDVRLTFNEPIGPLQARWFLPGASEAVDVEARASDATLIVTPPDTLSEGTHVLSWRVVSADGHPVGGTHVFSIGAVSEAAEIVADAFAWPALFARGLLTAALAFGVGGAFWRLVSGAASSRPARWLAASTLPAAGLLLAAQVMDMAGSGIGALAGAANWSNATASPFGHAAILAGFAGLAALLALSWRRRDLATLAWFLAAGSFAVAGHAARAEPVMLMAPLVFAHALAMIFWVGALPVLIADLDRDDALRRLQRFSRLAMPMVLVLVGTGLVLTIRQVETVTGLLETPYGLLLTAKIVVVIAVLLLALRHRFILTPAMAALPQEARPRFARSIRIEIVAMLAILALTAGFRILPPPRAMSPPVETAIEAHLHGPTAMADIVMIPGRPGPNRIEITPLDGNFAPMTPLEVTVFLARPADGLEPIEIRADKDEDGIWRAGPVHLPPGGVWDMTLDILITDFEKAVIGTELTLPP
jgi:copper transport protein